MSIEKDSSIDLTGRQIAADRAKVSDLNYWMSFGGPSWRRVFEVDIFVGLMDRSVVSGPRSMMRVGLAILEPHHVGRVVLKLLQNL